MASESEKSLLLSSSDSNTKEYATTPATTNNQGYTSVQVGAYIQPSQREKLGLILYEWLLLLLGVAGALAMGATPLLFYYFFGNLIGEVPERPFSLLARSLDRPPLTLCAS